MSRWAKNIVVPLDALCKEKETTNRPTVARSVGTVGKWGKMGFTSTRTYTLSALPAAVAAAAAAAAAASPAQSPASAGVDDDMSPSVPEPPKPKKFFKSRNAAPPEVIAQIIQHLPRVPTSPLRDSSGGCASLGILSMPIQGLEPIKMRIGKSSSAEKKKKTPKKPAKIKSAASGEETAEFSTPAKPEPKSKKKKEIKELKPEATPSRVTARARKAVNYCEDDYDDRGPTPIKDLIMLKDKSDKFVDPTEEINNSSKSTEPILPPPPPSSIALPLVTPNSTGPIYNPAPKTPEHPPIVLRISKGTSRLVSTDSEEQQNNYIASPQQQTHSDTELAKTRHSSTEDVPAATLPTIYTPVTPKIIVKPPRPPSPITTSIAPAPQLSLLHGDDPSEINYCTVKISPDKPPKERLKLIIKTDVIRNALAAAAAAAAAKAAAAAEKAAEANNSSKTDNWERPTEKEKKQKNKKHKHLKHSAIEQLTSASQVSTQVQQSSEFKTPSPHLAFGTSSHIEQQNTRTIVSPPALSERDFDSQSSVLGSISSKGNSTPQLLTQTVQEESCVIRSRGSSVITSDLETSQHSSLVAPPSDIESRLESMMMMDGEVSQNRAPMLAEEEPLQEDILSVLRGDESQIENETLTTAVTEEDNTKINGIMNKAEDLLETEADISEPIAAEANNRRATRARPTRGAATKANYVEQYGLEDLEKVPTATRTRNRKAPASTDVESDSPPTKRATRRGAKKVEEAVEIPMEIQETNAESLVTQTNNNTETFEDNSKSAKYEEESDISTVGRRGRFTRNANINNNITINSSNNNNNNNNINKIAANLTAKAGAAEEAKAINTVIAATPTIPPVTRQYGRKRKNQQVTQVLQPSAEELEEIEQLPAPAKIPNVQINTAGAEALTMPTAPPTILPPSAELQDNNSSNSTSNSNLQVRPHSTTPSSPTHHDYKIKDRFKRTLTLDNQANCNAVQQLTQHSNENAEPRNNTVATTLASNCHDQEDQQQRAAVKLVISKKKGSIFKSRALVPPDQSEQSAAMKRSLYKHSWDAEANGGAHSDGNSPSTGKTNDSNAQPSTTNSRIASDSIYDDFDSSTVNTSTGIGRDASPATVLTYGRQTRAQKNNATYGAYDTNTGEPSSSTSTDASGSLRVDRKAKEYYTVVRNVKSAHQIQEIGEYQEMDDDVEYILDALQPHNPMPTRCLSALQLATKCMAPAFRMHVRAHGVVTKFFKALSDANSDMSLGLCTSAIMYILTQEGLNMDLDRDSLELMMNLLESDAAAPSDRANYERNKQKVRELCEEIKAQGKATHLNVEAINVGTLAMETLLSLTSKRAGEWFKEELRELGGLEHIIKTISDCCRPVLDQCANIMDGVMTEKIQWTQTLLDNMRTVERCLRVLENVTQLNEENQKYIVTYAQGSAVNTLCTLFCLCDYELKQQAATSGSNSNMKEQPGNVMLQLMMPLMKVLINLTHTFIPSSPIGAETLGQRLAVIETSFHLLLQAPNYIPDRWVFELSILGLLLLINLTMHTVANRKRIMESYAPLDFGTNHLESQSKITAIEALMGYFYKCEELARLVEKNTDAFLENTDKNKKKQEEVDETMNNLVQKAGHHMEHTLKGSYAGILIGHLITDSEEYETIVRTHLHGNGFKEIVSVLEKYYTFMNLTASSEASVVAHIKSTKKLIDYFKKRDLVYEMNDSNDCGALPLNLETHHESSSNVSPIATTTRSAPRVYKTYSQR